jgi:uncharacterized protein YqgV (UPF0045/DUF77 family)
MVADIQVIPFPAGTPENQYAHVDAAIAVLAASGLKTTVHGLGTTIEGPADVVWETVRRAFDACLAAGASKELMMLKLYEGPMSVEALKKSGQAAADTAAASAARK